MIFIPKTNSFLLIVAKFVVLLLFFACINQMGKEQRITMFDPVDSTGLWQTYSADGSLFIEGEYYDGMRIGVWSNYNDSGHLIQRVIYQDTLRDENNRSVNYMLFSIETGDTMFCAHMFGDSTIKARMIDSVLYYRELRAVDLNVKDSDELNSSDIKAFISSNCLSCHSVDISRNHSLKQIYDRMGPEAFLRLMQPKGLNTPTIIQFSNDSTLRREDPHPSYFSSLPRPYFIALTQYLENMEVEKKMP